MSNSTTWASVAAVASFLIFERMKKRKRLLIILNIVSRAMICSVIFLPLVSNDNLFILTTATLMVVIGNVIWGVYNIGITVMMVSLLSKENRNHYIYVRTFWIRISFTLSTIAMGFLLDLFNKSYTGFFIVFIFSLLFSLMDAIVLSKVKEPSYSKDEETRVNIKMLFEPIKNKRYLHFLIFIFSIFVSLTAASSFTPLYLIRYLKLDYGIISLTNVITYILMIVCTSFWRKMERKKGLNFVLRISSIFIVSEVLIYSFLTGNTFYLLILAPAASGIGYSGFNIAIMNYRYEIIPENNRTIYEGWFGAVLGLSMLISPVIGTFIMKLIPVFQNRVYEYSNFQLLFLIASICGAIAVYMAFYRRSMLIKADDKLKNITEVL